MDLDYWNKKLYPRDENAEKWTPPKNIGADWFWDNFQIKSAPKFREACWFHIPNAWADDVANLITAIRNCFGDGVEFTQIKEKFCYLTVYYSAKAEIRPKVDEMIKHTQAVLRNKGLHP